MRSFMEKFGKFLDATGVFARRLVVFIVLLFLVIGLLSSFGSSDQQPEISDGAILNLNINGFLVEELSLSEFERAFAEFTGETSTETLVSDVITVIETAKNDELVDYLLLDLDKFLGGNPTKLQIIAEHGSWNRSEKIGYRITTVALDGDKGVSYEVFADGWMKDEETLGRPADILILDDGSMLVSDDKNGVIYKITYGE